MLLVLKKTIYKSIQDFHTRKQKRRKGSKRDVWGKGGDKKVVIITSRRLAFIFSDLIIRLIRKPTVINV